MPKSAMNFYNTKSNYDPPGTFSNASAGMQYFPNKNKIWNVLGDIAAFAGGALTADRGGLAAGANAVMNRVSGRNYYNQLMDYLQQQTIQQGKLSKAYGQGYTDAEVTGLGEQVTDPVTGKTSIEYPIGLDPDALENIARFQQQSNTSRQINDNYITGKLQALTTSLVDPEILNKQGEKIVERMQLINDSRNYPQSTQAGVQGYVNNLGQLPTRQALPPLNPTGQQIQLPSQVENVNISNPLIAQPGNLFQGKVSANLGINKPETISQNGQLSQITPVMPNIYEPAYDRDLYKYGLEQGYNRQFEAPKLEAETQLKKAERDEIYQGRIPNYKASASESSAKADAYRRGPGLGNYPPAGPKQDNIYELIGDATKLQDSAINAATDMAKNIDSRITDIEKNNKIFYSNGKVRNEFAQSPILKEYSDLITKRNTINNYINDQKQQREVIINKLLGSGITTTNKNYVTSRNAPSKASATLPSQTQKNNSYPVTGGSSGKDASYFKSKYGIK